MRRLTLLLLCSPFLACGPPASDSGGGGGGGGGGNVPETIDSAIEAYQDAFCEGLTRCNDTVQASLLRQFFFEFGGDQLVHAWNNKEHCKNLVASDMVKNLRATIAAGRVNVDLSKAQACFDSMSQCSLETQSPECREFIAPNQQLGDPCGNPSECTTKVCSAEPGQCGECVNPAALGEACSLILVCAEDGECDPERSVCVAKTPKSATGQPCESDLSSIEGNCENPMDLCVDNVCTTYTLAQAGEACGDTGDKLCALGSICIDDVCVSEPASIGATCQVPDGEEQMKRSALCPVDARCDTLTSNCVGLSSASESCSGDSECTRGNYCSDSVCSAKEAIDADCDSDSECDSDTCTDGICVERVALTCE